MAVKTWKNEEGYEIPVSRITPAEKLQERQAKKLLKEASKISEQLEKFHALASEVCDEVYQKVMEEAGVDTASRKGNFTWYNFDRSIKIEVAVQARIQFDEMKIAACKEKLDQFLEQNISTSDDFIKEIIMDAFETNSGNLDTRKVLSLTRHRSKVRGKENKRLYNEAMDLLEESIRRPDSKRYFRVWTKDSNGEYQSVNLNFSSIA